MTTKNFVVKNGLTTGNITLDALTDIITTTGNVSAANLLTGGQVSATGNITGNNLSIGNIVSAGGNLTAGNISTAGNANLGNIITTGLFTSSGNIAFTGSNAYFSNVSNIHIPGGTANYVLTTDGSGNVSWEPTGRGDANVAGANTEIQFNDDGNLGASANLTFNKSSNTFSTYTINVSGNLNFTGPNAYFSNVANIHIPGGTANYVLTTDGTGNVSWEPTGRGDANVAGNNTEVQFNNNGNLGASNAFTFNTTTNALSATYFVGDGSNLANIAGANVTGTVANANHACTANVVTDGTQSNITAVGTLTSLSSSGNITGANLLTGGILSANGNVTGNYILGNGFYLTGVSTNSTSILNGNSNVVVEANSNITVGVAGNANVVVFTGTGVNVTGYVDVTANLSAANANLGNAATANFFIGSGNNLSNIQGSNVTGTVANANYAAYAGDVVNASQPNITSVGTLSSLSVSGNANVGNVNTGIISASGNLSVANANLGNAATANYFIGNGSSLSSLTGANVTGTVANATHASTANTVVDANQSNITSVGTLTNLSISGNANVGNNVNVSGNAVITGNLVVGGNTVYINVETIRVEDPIIELGGGPNGDPLTTDDGKDRGTLLHYYAGAPIDAFMGWDESNSEFALGSNVTVTNDVVTFNTFGNLRLSGLIANTGNFIGNLDANNVNTSNIVSATGNIKTSGFFVGDGGYISNITVAAGSYIVNGTSNVHLDSNGNLHVDIAGNTDKLVVTSTGANVNGYLTVSGNLESGNANLGNAATANYFIGSGNNLSNIQGSNVLGAVGLATYATTANAVAGANVSGEVANANYSSYTNVANTANAVAGANVSGAVAYATTANAVAGANVSGEVANANYASYANIANTANAVAGANVSGVVANANYAAYAGNITIAGQSNITAVGTLTSLSVSGNVDANNLNTSNIVSATGNIKTSGFFVGDGGYISNIVVAAGSYIVNGNSNVHLDTDGNLHVDIGGITDRLLVTTTGIIANSTISAIGNITGSNLLTGGLISATGNLTSGNVNTGRVSASANITGANLLTGGLISATGNLTSGNVNTGIVFASGNVTGANLNTGGLISASGNINVGNVNTGIVSANGNVTGGNILTAGEMSGTGNITTANYFIGNGYYLTGIDAGVQDKIANGNSNVYIPTANGDVTITASGNANIVVVTGTGANISGTANITGNANVGNIGTGVLTATGNITGVNLLTAGQVSASGNVTGNFILGNGYYLTGLNVGVQDKIANGNSNVYIPTANGDVTITANGNANIVVVTGTGANITGYANVSGNLSAGNITYTGELSTAGNINFTGANAYFSNVANIKIPGGTANYVLTTDGAGNLSWQVTGTGNGNANVAGTNTQVQFNDDGVLGANANFTFNKVTETLSVTNITTAGNAVIAGNLTVSGTTEYINVTNLAIKDPIISIGRGTNNAPLTSDDGKDRGEQLWYYSGSEKSGFIGYDNSTGKIIAATDVTISSEVVTVSTYGNFVVGGLEAATVSGSGNITGANLLTGGLISATGNIDANNVNVGNIISAAGNITGNYILGNGAFLTGVATGTPSNIANGTSNINIPVADGNINTSVGGAANVFVVTSTGANITGTANVSGNLSAGNINVVNALSASANITGANLNTGNNISAAGTITANNINLGNVVSAGGNVTGANLLTGGLISATGNINGNNIIASGNLSATSGIYGTIQTASQPNITSLGTLTGLTVGPNSSVILSGNTGYVRANSIQGRDGTQSIYMYYGNVSGAVATVTDLTVGASGSGNLVIANGAANISGNINFTGANAYFSNVGNLRIPGGSVGYFLKTDGSGNLSWDQASATPGGSPTELQFNNTGLFGGTANLEFDTTEYRLSIQNYSIVVQALGGVSGATTVNITNGCYVTATAAGITTWIFSFSAPSGNASGFVLELTNGGLYTVNWPLSVKWPGGTAPDLTSSGTDVLVFITNDNGTTWRGAVSMLNSL